MCWGQNKQMLGMLGRMIGDDCWVLWGCLGGAVGMCWGVVGGISDNYVHACSITFQCIYIYIYIHSTTAIRNSIFFSHVANFLKIVKEMWRSRVSPFANCLFVLPK